MVKIQSDYCYIPRSNMEALEKFRELIRREFNFLCDNFEFRELSVNSYNEYTVNYANSTTIVVVEGINWGANARVALGSIEHGFENYDLGDIATIKCPDLWESFAQLGNSQSEQLPYLHNIKLEAALDILTGDFSVFPQLDEIRRKREKEFDEDEWL